MGDADVPTVTFPSGALYRLLVRNIGVVALENVVVNDNTLGIVDFPGGRSGRWPACDLDPGRHTQLNVTQRCDSAGTFISNSTAVELELKKMKILLDKLVFPIDKGRLMGAPYFRVLHDGFLL